MEGCLLKNARLVNVLVCMLNRSVVSDSLQPHGLQPVRLLCPSGFSRQEYWSGLPFAPPGDLPNPGIKPGSPALQADSLPPESRGKPKNTGVGSLSLLQGIFLTQEQNWGLLNCRWILYQLSYQGSPVNVLYDTKGVSQVVLVVRDPPANAGDIRDSGLIAGSERSSGGANGNPLQYSCLENPMD